MTTGSAQWKRRVPQNIGKSVCYKQKQLVGLTLMIDQLFSVRVVIMWIDRQRLIRVRHTLPNDLGGRYWCHQEEELDGG